MTREDSIRTKTWVTNDGRYLPVDEITSDHLRAIRRMLCEGLPPGYDQAAGREVARAWVARTEREPDFTAELDRDAYAAAWIQIVDDELNREGRR